MIERPSIIVTSLGRTGTTFFAFLFGQIIRDCDSFHEPDIVQYFGTQDRYAAFIKRVKDAGVYNMVFLKLLGKWSLIKVSDDRLRGDLSYERAAREVLKQRAGFVNSKPGSVYVESNAGYYGLLDVLNDVYRQHKAIYLIRDGREWVSSAMNVEELYGKKGLRKILAHKMPTAREFPADPFFEKWTSMTRFEKLCWAWSRLNEYAMSAAAENPDARVFQFEKIFTGKERYEHLDDLVRFATSTPATKARRSGNLDGLLDRKVNQSSKEFPAWENWSMEEKKQFEEICGPLMEKIGYPL